MNAGGTKVVPLGPDWPGHPLPVMPGDFSQYVPHGMGIGAPWLIRPWDSVAGPSSNRFYGFDSFDADPVRGAPTHYASGGVVYFGEEVSWDRLKTVFSVMGVRLREFDYLVIAREADDPLHDRYLDQVRIASRHGLGHMFEPGPTLGTLPKQPIPIEEYVQQFIAEQQEKWSSAKLRGTAGGDGDWAKERLAFGFMVENAYWAIYRMWTRPWLITK